jgi:glycosyltransferase involved in cell wall biosynthesis
MSEVTICIPTIGPRKNLLDRAVASVQRQDRPTCVSVAEDLDHSGAWATRNRAVEGADTEWIGFLDDDDRLLPWHVSHLLEQAEEHQADMVWGWFEVVGGADPFPHYRGRQYDPANPHIVPITYLVRRELWLDTPGFQPDTIGSWDLQDQPVIDAIHQASGGALHASETITWYWFHHGGNTSGLPTRW